MGADERRMWLRAGRVGRPHGLDGSFHVLEPNPLLLAHGSTLHVEEEDRRIERRAGHEGRLIIRLEGCADRDSAEALRGAELLVAREGAPELGPDEWWAEELEGCAVRDRGRLVGTVTRMLALPSCEVLEVAPTVGGEPLLVPLIADAVRSVDVSLREIDVDLEFLGVE